MSRVFITGSSDGLGLMAGRLLAAEGHSVVLHARNESRAGDTRAALSQAALPQADGVVIGDLTGVARMGQVAAQADAAGPFDAVNVLAPYLLTALIERPGRLVYLSSGMHRGGDTHPAARDVRVQEELLGYCAELTGTELPR